MCVSLTNPANYCLKPLACVCRGYDSIQASWTSHAAHPQASCKAASRLQTEMRLAGLLAIARCTAGLMSPSVFIIYLQSINNSGINTHSRCYVCTECALCFCHFLLVLLHFSDCQQCNNVLAGAATMGDLLQQLVEKVLRAKEYYNVKSHPLINGGRSIVSSTSI